MLEAVVGIGSGLELGTILRRIVTSAAALAGARYAALGVLGEDGQLSEFVHTGLPDRVVERIGPLPEGRGVLGLLLGDGEGPLRLDDLATHPASVGFPPGHPPMRSFLGVPVPVRGQAFGNLYLTEKAGGGGFTQADEDAVVALAAAAGVAVENARLYAQAQQWGRAAQAASDIDTAVLSGASTARRARADRRTRARGRRRRPGDARAARRAGRTWWSSTPPARCRRRRRRDRGPAAARQHRGRPAVRPGAQRRGAGPRRGGEPRGARRALPLGDLRAAGGRRPAAGRAAAGPRARSGPAQPGRGVARSRTSPGRRRWRSSWAGPSASASASRCTRTATGSPATCTTWSSSGCSRPG